MHCLKATYHGILAEQVGRLLKQKSDRSCDRSLCHLLDVGPSYRGGCTMHGPDHVVTLTIGVLARAGVQFLCTVMPVN
jgi:hypothetical protein